MKIRQSHRPALMEPLEPRLLMSITIPLVYRLPRIHAPAGTPALDAPRDRLPHPFVRMLERAPRPALQALAPLAALSTAAAPALLAPVASLVSASATQINLSATPATGGLGAYTYQWYRGTSAGFLPSAATLLANAASLTLADQAQLDPSLPYFYCLAATDGQSTTFSNQVIGALAIPTTPIALPTQSGPTLLTYIGSSTWAINQGSGQIPSLIDSDLRTTAPAANFTTFNGAVSGTTTFSFLPGTSLSNAVRSAVLNFSGYKVLRLMIGSNDAASGQPVSKWLSNMHTIIQDALSWPVNLIVLEEIGLRLDGGNATLDLIRQYNAARASLLGPNIVLGTAHTYEDEALHLATLSGDLVHQTNAGQIDVAANQSTELAALVAPPSIFNLTADNTAYYVSDDPTQSLLQISLGTASSIAPAPAWSIPLAALPSLTFNLLGSNNAIYFDFTNGAPIPPGNITVTGSNNARLYLLGQSTSQTFTLTDSQVAPTTGTSGNIAYQNIAELHLLRGTFNYTGSLTSFALLDIGNQAILNWN